MTFDPLDYLLGKGVLVDLGGYSVAGRLISCRQGELTLQPRRGSRNLVNRLDTRSIRELVSGKKRQK